MAEYSDLLLLGGLALCVISVIAAIIQLLQTQPPRSAVITLILGIVLLFAGAYYAPQPLQPQSILSAWTRVTGGEAEAPAEEATGGQEEAATE